MRSLVGELFWGGGTRVCLVGVELITFSDYDACDYSLFECHHCFVSVVSRYYPGFRSPLACLS